LRVDEIGLESEYEKSMNWFDLVHGTVPGVKGISIDEKRRIDGKWVEKARKGGERLERRK